LDGDTFWAALALVLVLEGLLPLLSPGGLARHVPANCWLRDGQLRFFGLLQRAGRAGFAVAAGLNGRGHAAGSGEPGKIPFLTAPQNPMSAWVLPDHIADVCPPRPGTSKNSAANCSTPPVAMATSW
jgi:uncharacterized protein YjeT (DUF2065 family)